AASSYSHQGGGLSNFSGWASASFGQIDTLTSTHTTTTTTASAYARYEGGSFAAGSFALGSFNLYQADASTLTLDSSAVASSAQSGSYAAQFTAGGVDMYHVSGTFSSSAVDTDTEQRTVATSFSVREQGSYGAGGFSLSCFAYAVAQSSTATVGFSDSGGGVFAGTDTAGGANASYSGLQTSGGGGTEVLSSSGSLAEQGSYSGGSFSLNTVSF